MIGKKDGESMLGFIIAGSISNLSGDDTIVTSPLENAKKNEEQGMSLRDAEIMRMAAARYRERNKANDTLRCEAFADEFEEKYRSAGKKFEEADLFDDAIRCYWLVCANGPTRQDGMHALESLKKYRCENLIIRIAIQYLKVKPDINEVYDFLVNLCNILSGQDHQKQTEIFDLSTQWQAILKTLLERIEIASTKSTKDQMRAILGQCNKLTEKELPLDMNFQAEWFSHLGETEKAVQMWEKMALQDKTTLPENYYRAKAKIVSYPENLEFYTHISEWETEVLNLYRKLPSIKLSPRQELIITKAVLKSGGQEELRRFLPKLLLEDNAISILDDVAQRDTSVPKNYLKLLLLCKLDKEISQASLDDLSGSGNTKEIQRMGLMIKAMKVVRSKKFIDFLNKSFREGNKKVIDVMNDEFQGFSRTIWNQPLLTEIGGVFEKRGHFLDALRYYEWAEGQTEDRIFKDELTLRWIVCKERQADNSNGPSQHREDAKQKRKEIGLDISAELPPEPVFSRWPMLFEKVMNFTEGLPKEQPVEVINPSSLSTSVPLNTPENSKNRIFDTNFFGYSFRFNPAAFELRVELRTSEEDLSVKIRNGRIPEDADFLVKEGRLFKSSGGQTCFQILISETEITLTHTESGAQIRFPR